MTTDFLFGLAVGLLTPALATALLVLLLRPRAQPLTRAEREFLAVVKGVRRG